MYLTESPIDPAALITRVQAADRGGTALFLGTVRDHHAGRRVSGLSYSSYKEMAEAECARIVQEAEGRWPVALAVLHRLGDLAVGEVAVGVAAAAAHRDAAFEAARWVIEELKQRVPIWKRERYVDGSVAWVDPTSAAGIRPAQPVEDA
jgi:molybdopterin synthase catalytic subunit